jgi:hypothetical protein
MLLHVSVLIEPSSGNLQSVLPDDGLLKTETCRSICYIFSVNFNVLKQIYCALVGVIKDWISQNARHNCGN